MSAAEDYETIRAALVAATQNVDQDVRQAELTRAALEALDRVLLKDSDA